MKLWIILIDASFCYYIQKEQQQKQSRIQDFWLGGGGKPQITCNDVIGKFFKEELLVGQRNSSLEDQ